MTLSRNPGKRRIAVALLNLGALLMLGGALFDLSFTAPPPFWRELIGDEPLSLPPGAVRLMLSLLRALGFALLGLAIGVLILVNGPVRRGSRGAAAAVLAMVVVGEGGNGVQMVLSGAAYGWAVLGYIVPVVAGLLLLVPTPTRGAVGRTDRFGSVRLP